MINISTNHWSIDSINAVLFDKDGTLIDSHKYWGRIIERRALALISKFHLDKALFSDICLTMGLCTDKWKLIKEGPIALVNREQVIKILADYLLKLNIQVSHNDIDEIFVREHNEFLNEIFDYIELLPDVIPLLKAIKAKSVKIAVVTSDSVKNTEETLKYLKIDNYFDLIIGKESTVEPKHTGIPALKAMELLKANNNETICIGDAPMDLIMAKNADLKAGIGITTGQIDYDELLEYSPYISTSLGDINIKEGLWISK
ncbi:MAG: HAD family hydrolase [bacterium]